MVPNAEGVTQNEEQVGKGTLSQKPMSRVPRLASISGGLDAQWCTTAAASPTVSLLSLEQAVVR
jgi:hypothetical protein